jgi:hypothetical protein
LDNLNYRKMKKILMNDRDGDDQSTIGDDGKTSHHQILLLFKSCNKDVCK